MKLTMNKPVEIEAEYIRLVLPVDYEEEDIPNDFPLRSGETWIATVRISDGQIQEPWPSDRGDLSLAMKVTDGSSYYLLDSNQVELAAHEDDYVPACIPGEYGDYVDLKISPSGKITNWNPTADSVQNAFFSGDDDD